MADMVAGDTNRMVRVTCTFTNSVDVTGASAALLWRITSVGGRPGNLVTASMTNLTPATGSTTSLVADYTFTAGQLKPGKMTAEVRITDGAGLVITSDDVLEYTIRARV